MNDCVNLKERFGDRFKVELEEAHRAETVDRPTEAPWLMVIPCDHGHIYPHGDSILSAYSDRPGARKKLKGMACCTIHQEGEKEVTVNFDVKDFDQVAEVMKPRKRNKGRAFTEEEIRASIERLKKYRFKPGQSGRTGTDNA